MSGNDAADRLFMPAPFIWGQSGKPGRILSSKRLPRCGILLWNCLTGKEEDDMNIQIFGTKKSSDTRKAERFFKERGIKFQSVDLKEKGLSKGEFRSVMQSVGGIDRMIDPECKDKDLLALIRYIAAEDKEQKVFENQAVLRMPVVRNGREATVGYCPEIWKTWN